MCELGPNYKGQRLSTCVAVTVVRAWKPSSQSLAGAARSVTVRGAAQADARCRVKPRCEPAPSHSDGAPTASVGEPSQHSVRSSSDISIDPDWYGSCHVVAPASSTNCETRSTLVSVSLRRLLLEYQRTICTVTQLFWR